MRDISLITKKNIDVNYFRSKLSALKWRIAWMEEKEEIQITDDEGYYLRIRELDHALSAEDYALLENNPIPTDEARYFMVVYQKKALLQAFLEQVADHPDVWVDLEDAGIFWGPEYVKTLETSASVAYME